jgi:hypothetical protein
VIILKNETIIQKNQAATHTEKAEVLPYLNMQEAKADYALPFCEKKNCIDVDIQTIKTQDEWLKYMDCKKSGQCDSATN